MLRGGPLAVTRPFCLVPSPPTRSGSSPRAWRVLVRCTGLLSLGSILSSCGGSEPSAPDFPAVTGAVSTTYPSLEYLLFPGEEVVDSLRVEVQTSAPVELELQRQVVPAWLELELVHHGVQAFVRYGIRAGAGPRASELARFRIAARDEPSVEPGEVFIDLLVESVPDARADWRPFCVDGPAVRGNPLAPSACMDLTLYQWLTPGGSRIMYDFRNLQGSLGGEWDTSTGFQFFVILRLPGDGVPVLPEVRYARTQGKVGQEGGDLIWRPDLWDPRMLQLDAPNGDQVLGCAPSPYDHIERPRATTCRPRGETGSVIVLLDAPGLTESISDVSAGIQGQIQSSSGYDGLSVTCVPWPPANVCP